MARTHFSGPIRLADALQTTSGGGKNAAATNIINVAGNYVESAGSVMLNRQSRKAFVSAVTIGVSGTDTEITAIRVYSATIGSGSIGANSVVLSSYTLTGLTTADKVFVIPPNSGISSGGGGSQLGIAYAGVSAADTLFIGWLNPTGAANIHVTNTYTIVAIRS